MSNKQKTRRVKPRLPRGMRDVEARELRATQAMLAKIRAVYELYGFEPLDTPAFEYTEALGKFLPDSDRPNEGVFSFQDEDEDWLSLRYDLTAPLARYVATRFDQLPKPFRRYQAGPVWRNEKPGPGRYRQFVQFDADTVGTASIAADAEMCMLAADTLEALGLEGQYVIRVNNRKVLDGVMETIGLDGETNAGKRLMVLRAIDKLDRLGLEGVKLLLGEGRKDESGDITKGANLREDQIDEILSLLDFRGIEELIDSSCGFVVKRLIDSRFNINSTFLEGAKELGQIADLVEKSGYETDRIVIDPSVVRGLEYYTGPVYEAELTFATDSAEGGPARFGSVGGGGRYDGLVARFKGAEVPATGFSIGVSRLYAALDHLGLLDEEAGIAPVVVLAMDQDRIGDYQKMVKELRDDGIRAEMYLGLSGMKPQMKYADKRGSPCVVICGEDEFAQGEVTIKDLVEGAKLSEEIADNAEWREGRPAQVSVRRDELVSAVRGVLARRRD